MLTDVAPICDEIRKNYSPCDVSDALLVLNVPGGGYLSDIHPFPSRSHGRSRLVAPISTIAFVAKSHKPGDDCDLSVPESSNLSRNTHWTDLAPTGSVVVMQQPSDQIAGLLGDIVATRYKARGVAGVFIDGHGRDVRGVGALCEDGKFQAWTKKLTSVGTSLQAKPWAVDIPLKIGLVEVKPGDVIVADEAERVCCVIPQDKLIEVAAWLPRLKKADDGILEDVQGGMNLKESFARWPEHYTNQH